MSCILHIETSTEACSVAVSEDGLAVFSKEDLKGPSHAVQLGVFVDEALSFVDSHGMPLDAVAVSCGPGSYTGLRIGVCHLSVCRHWRCCVCRCCYIMICLRMPCSVL